MGATIGETEKRNPTFGNATTPAPITLEDVMSKLDKSEYKLERFNRQMAWRASDTALKHRETGAEEESEDKEPRSLYEAALNNSWALGTVRRWMLDKGYGFIVENKALTAAIRTWRQPEKACA